MSHTLKNSKSWISRMYFTLVVHFNPGKSDFKCSVVTCGLLAFILDRPNLDHFTVGGYIVLC